MNDIEVLVLATQQRCTQHLSAQPQMVKLLIWHKAPNRFLNLEQAILKNIHSTFEMFASSSQPAVSEWMLLYCLEWASVPVGKMTIPDCRPALKECTNENSSGEKHSSLSLSQAKHLLSILMGINGRAGTGDRGVDWLAGPALTQPPLSILPALMFTANTSCCALPMCSAPADVYIRDFCTDVCAPVCSFGVLCACVIKY